MELRFKVQGLGLGFGVEGLGLGFRVSGHDAGNGLFRLQQGLGMRRGLGVFVFLEEG